MTSHLLRRVSTGVLFLPATALAHPGHDASSFVAGLAHPFDGIDHLLAMVAVGMLASRLQNSARWSLSLTFIVAMTMGAMAAATFALPSVELMIAFSLVVFGAAIAIARQLPTTLSFAAVSLFALFHGAAHGAEWVGSSLLAFCSGFIISTAALLATGLSMTLRAREIGQSAQVAIRISGGVIAGTGAALLFPFA